MTAALLGDGTLHVLSASPTDAKIAWCENLGNGSFGLLRAITNAANDAHCVTTAALLCDETLHVLPASGLDHNIAWYENVVSVNFAPSASSPMMRDCPDL